MNQEKYIGMDVQPRATISVAVMDSSGEADHGMHPGDESSHDSRVPRWATRKSIRDL